MTSTIRLGELITIRGGGTPSRSVPEYWNGEIRWATVKDFKSTELAETEESITQEGIKDSATNVIPAGSVIVPTRMAVGKAAINTIDLAINQDLKALLPGAEVDTRFLLHFMLAQGKYLESQAQGATVKGIKLDLLRSLPFPKIPPIEQRRIAAVLDKADAIRRKREQTVTLADDFLKSVFLDMFGDPVGNTKNWPQKPLGLTCSKITDGTHDTPPRQSSGVMFITGKNIRPFKIDSKNVEFVSEEVHREIYRRCNPEFGDVLYTNIGAGTGNAAFNDLKFEFSMKNVALLKPNIALANGRYLEFLLNNEIFKQRLISRFGQGGAQGFLGLKTIKSIEIPLPPMVLQTRFCELAERTKTASARIELAKLSDESLFLSLTQRAFRGEL